MSHRVTGIGLGRWPLRGKLAPMMGRASGVEGVFLPALLLALVGCAGPRPAPIESAAPSPALSATAADTTPEPPAPLPPDALAARSSSALASPPPAPVASAPSAGLGAAPGCGAFAPKFTEARAGAQALVYYERTLRRLVRDWGRKAWQGPQVATASYIDSMAVLLPRVEHVRRASGAEARAATEAAPGRPLSRSLVCGGSAAGERVLWVVSLYLNERSRPVPPDSGVWLDIYVDELSGEVVQVVHLPLG